MEIHMAATGGHLHPQELQQSVGWLVIVLTVSWTREGVLAGVKTLRDVLTAAETLTESCDSSLASYHAAVGNIFAGLGSIVSQTVSGTSGFRFRLPAASVSLKAITGALGSYQPNLLPNFSRLLTFHKVRCGVAHHWITLDFHIWKTTKINVNY